MSCDDVLQCPWFLHSNCVTVYLVGDYVVMVQLSTRYLGARFHIDTNVPSAVSVM